MKIILDACCGSRMFWFDKENKNTVFCDNRELETVLCDGRTLTVKPDMIADFTDLPFENNRFYMVVFDPPHLLKAGESSWLAQKYGVLPDNWKTVLANGFAECMRVLKPHGTLIFKWNEEQIPTSKVLRLFKSNPLFGDRRGKTRWIVFMKEADNGR